jgi:hypothetical protein
MPDPIGIELLELNGFVVAYDAGATKDLYALIRQGDSERCTCAPCVSYIQQREQAYPDEFIALLQRLGVDWRRDSEVHYKGKAPGGLELYGGCFHFVGQIRQTANQAVPIGANLTIDFDTSLNDVPPEFADKPVVQLNFEVGVPRS